MKSSSHSTAGDGPYLRAIRDIIERLARKYDPWRVWSDFVEVSAIVLARLDLKAFEAREKRYLNIVGRYTRDELDAFCQAFANLGLAFDACFSPRPGNADLPFGVSLRDVLGQLYMQLELGNKHLAQFFTPYEVSRLNAALVMHDAPQRVQRQGFIKALEPACGAGGMVIAMADVLAGQGLNYQKALHVTAIDVSATCAHMTFVQCALLHIPALIVNGNFLSGQVHGLWPTPAHILGRWSWRLEQDGKGADVIETTTAAAGKTSSARSAWRWAVDALRRAVSAAR